MNSFYIRRTAVLICSFTLASFFLIFRLYTLSTDSNKALEVLSGQYTRQNTAVYHDGLIYDTKGRLLSHTADESVAIVNTAVTDRAEAADFLSEYSGYAREELLEKMKYPIPFTLTVEKNAEKIPKETIPDGISLFPLYTPTDNGFCRHLLGYRNADGEGMSGLYRSLDTLLSQYSGSLSYRYTADAMGGIFPSDSFVFEDKSYSTDAGVILTIDSDVQEKIDRICDENMDMGAVIVTSLDTGGILALSSRPLYDALNVAKYLDSDDAELINRAFSLYTPGSVFKAVVAAAALEKDASLYNMEYECTGVYDVSGKEFVCHKKDGHGVQSMKEAFANSCNTYFINLMKETGFEYILTLCNKMGLGSKSIIDGFLIDAAEIPDMSESYPDAYKANFAFGQGDLLLTPVDVMNIYTICATGKKRDLSLIKGLYTKSSGECIYFEEKEEERVLSAKTVAKMRRMMEECVKTGTGKEAASQNVRVGGKTATAQSGQIKDGAEVIHRWFAGVFPADNPKYAAVVLCDGNGSNNMSPQKIFSLCTDAVYDFYYN